MLSKTRIWLLILITPLLLAFLRHTTVEKETHDHDHPLKVADAAVYRPTGIPDRIILSWTGDPATSQAVSWRSDLRAEAGLAQIGIATDGPEYLSEVDFVVGESTRLDTDIAACQYHTVVFEGLQPKTKYVYRVGDGVNWSEWAHFTTASNQPDPFTFVYFGDAQNDLKSHWSRVVREAFLDTPKIAFLLHAGDLVNHANSDAEWGEWFYAGGFVNRSIPTIATPGNHEYLKTKTIGGITLSYRLSQFWRPVFAFPENGPEGLEESVYWIDYQGVRIISLNTNERHGVQARWLDKVLAENPNRWTIVTLHHPIFSSMADRNDPAPQAAWQPIFDKYRVDIVLQGHDHLYARSKLLACENASSDVTTITSGAGTVYVVSVSGSKMCKLNRGPSLSRAAEDTQLYQVITVDGDELQYEARTATSRLYDAFTLKKRPNRVNELIDRIPDAPERRRS